MNEGQDKCAPEPRDPEITRRISELNDVIFSTLDRLGTMADRMSQLGNLPPVDLKEQGEAPDPITVVQKLDAVLSRAKSINERVDYFNNFLGDLI